MEAGEKESKCECLCMVCAGGCVCVCVHMMTSMPQLKSLFIFRLNHNVSIWRRQQPFCSSASLLPPPHFSSSLPSTPLRLFILFRHLLYLFPSSLSFFFMPRTHSLHSVLNRFCSLTDRQQLLLILILLSFYTVFLHIVVNKISVHYCHADADRSVCLCVRHNPHARMCFGDTASCSFSVFIWLIIDLEGVLTTERTIFTFISIRSYV